MELEGKVLFYLRVNSKFDTAQKRAQTVSESILKLAEDPLFSPKSITVRDSELSSDIMAGDKVIYPLWEFEARVMGKPANELARDYADKIRQAIAAYQKEHSLRNLIIRIVKTVLALFALIILVILVNRGMRRLNRAILASDRIRSVKIGEFEFFTADRIKAVITSAVKMVRLLIILVLIYSYFHLGLSFFPTTQRYALKLYDSLLGAVTSVGEAIWDQTPALAFLAVLFFITRYVLKTLRFFFEQVSAGKVTVSGLDAEVAPITYRIVKILILAFVAVIAYPYIPGSQSSAFKGISIFLGVLFSLGSSSAIANLIAGVSLTYMRSFRVGDVIKVGDSTGVVLERRLYITRLKTFKNEVITIPNGIILTSHVTNLSQEVRTGERPDSPYQRHHRLRRPLGDGPRSAHRGGEPNRTYPQESAALRAANRAQRFLRGLRTERLYRCPGDHALDLRRTAPEYPEYLQRRRGGNHVASLYPDPGRQPHHHPGRLSAAGLRGPGHQNRQHGDIDGKKENT